MIISSCLLMDLVKSDGKNVNSIHTEDENQAQQRWRKQTTRVLNGVEVTPHEFPQLASIIYNGTNRCTGTIVTKDYVLASAFCVLVSYGYIPDLSRFRVIVGHHNISIRETSQQNLSVVDAILHQRYAYEFAIN